MMRGTFANVRLKNQLAPGTEGSHTTHFPSGESMSVFDAAQKYIADGIPSIVIAGKEYGTGSSRDWAAKGPALLGVRAVLAESYERIHRSNLIGMGILPLQFKPGDNAERLNLKGDEQFSIPKIKAGDKSVTVSVFNNSGDLINTFDMLIRIDTENEFQYYANGGILHFVIRRLLAQ
jgi:aconitate hydratase